MAAFRGLLLVDLVLSPNVQCFTGSVQVHMHAYMVCVDATKVSGRCDRDDRRMAYYLVASTVAAVLGVDV